METRRRFWHSRPATTEKVENGTALSVEAKRPRRRMKVILTLALSAALGGFLISYSFAPQYVAQSTVLVEGQKLPSNYVEPIITEDFMQRVQTVSQRILSASRLRPLIASMDLVKPGEEGGVMEDVRANMQVTPVISETIQAATTTPSGAEKRPSPTDGPVVGFSVSYADSKPERAQRICNTLTQLIMNENLRSRAEEVQSITGFLKKQVDDARTDLEGKNTQLLSLGKIQSPRSPEADAKYRVLALDHEVAQKAYVDLLTKLTKAKLGMAMESQQMGEQMTILQTAGLPESPNFPNRPLCALGGLGTGLLLGIGRVLWPTRKAKTESQAAIPHSDSAVPVERQA